MAPRFNQKYEQPYTSRHITRNIEDSLRADEAPYIKNFPRFIQILYQKQTPFQLDLLPYIKGEAVESNSKSKSSNKKSSPEKVSSAPRKQSDPQNSFRTVGKSTKEKSPPTQMSTLPSDFEHIFHYSEFD